MISIKIRPPPKPGQINVYKALSGYEAKKEDELSIEEGDVVYVLDSSTDNQRWKVKVVNKEGWVSSEYMLNNTESYSNPLHEAAKRGNVAFMKECIENKVSVNGLDKAGNTPLHWAAYGGHADCIVELVRTPGLLIDVQNRMGDTPLHCAAVKNRPNIVEMLIEKGAKLDLLNNDSKSPYDLAIDAKCKSLLESNVNQEQTLKRNSEYLDNENDSDE